jgi:hypothetical protein
MSAARAASPAGSRRSGVSSGEAPSLQSGASGQPLRAARPALERSTRAASIAEAVSRWLDQEL